MMRTHSPRVIGLYAFCVTLPLLSAASSYSQMRNLQLIMFLVVGMTVFVGATRSAIDRKDSVLALLIWSISLSLLLSSTLVSKNLTGYDIHQEFLIFLQVSRTGTYLSGYGFFYNSVLSISILPTVLELASNLDGVWIFKLFYPLVYSLTPVLLYKAYRQILAPKLAFLSAFLFMSYTTFYVELVAIAKQEVGELLLVLLFWLFLSKNMHGRRGILVVLLLTLGLVTAHYSLAYVYLLVLTFSVVSSYISKKFAELATTLVLMLTAVLVFSWYLYAASASALLRLVIFVSNVSNGLVHDFLVPGTRPFAVLQAAGLASVTPGLLHDMYRATNYAVQLCIFVGFIVFFRKTKKEPRERAALAVMTVGMIFLGAGVIVPYFAEGLNLSRIYHIALIFISPCFAVGAIKLSSLPKRISFHSNQLPMRIGSPRVVLAALLLSYFLFTSGWVWAISLDRPTSVVFDGQRMAIYPDDVTKSAYFGEYVVPQDFDGALWLRAHIGADRRLCSDDVSKYHVLTSYAEREQSTITILPHCDVRESYVYLSTLNTLYGVEPPDVQTRSLNFITNELTTELLGMNKVYSNGGAAIYD